MNPGALSKLKILIVEDESQSRIALMDILETLGVSEIFETDDGRHALQFLFGGDAPVDLVLCDWNMPVMSGVELFRLLRGGGNATAFLLITGRADHNSIMEARSIGVDGYIRKPFSPEQIEARLRIFAARMKAA